MYVSWLNMSQSCSLGSKPLVWIGLYLFHKGCMDGVGRMCGEYGNDWGAVIGERGVGMGIGMGMRMRMRIE